PPPPPAREEAGVEDDEFGSCRLRDPGGVVEHADRHSLLLVALDVTHEPRDRCVDGEHDPRLAGQVTEALGPGIVHPEFALEVDLAGGIAPFLQQFDCPLRTVSRRNSSGSESERAHGKAAYRRRSRAWPGGSRGNVSIVSAR